MIEQWLDKRSSGTKAHLYPGPEDLEVRRALSSETAQRRALAKRDREKENEEDRDGDSGDCYDML